MKQMVMPQSYQPMMHRHYGDTTGADLVQQPQKLDVQRIEEASCSWDGVVMVKLTDEMMSALEKAQRSGGSDSMKITVDEMGGVIDLGQGSSFRFQKQPVPGGPTDALVRCDGRVKNLGACAKRYQIQATEKSFEDTRKRAEKRAEEEKNRGTRQVKQRKDGKLLQSSTIPTKPTVPTSSFTLKTPAMSSSTSAPSSGAQPPSGRNEQLRAELLRRPLRKRIIHLVVLQQFANWQEIFKRLKTEGVNPKEDPSERRISDMVRELSETTTSPSGESRLSLRTSFYPEVDQRWPFFTQDEKSAVRKLVNAQPLTSNDMDSSSFAPTRKKGMERMTASSRALAPPATATTNGKGMTPSATTSTLTTLPPPTQNGNGGSSASSTVSSRGQTVSPESIPTPPTLSRPSSGGSSVPATKQKGSPMSDEELLNYAAQTQTGAKRKAHVPNHVLDASSNEKRPRRQESASPPEDPTMRTPQQLLAQNSTPNTIKQQPKGQQQSKQTKPQSRTAPSRPVQTEPVAVSNTTINANINNTSANNGGGSTASSHLSSPASSLASPTCDWEKALPALKSAAEAKNYTEMFNREYPQYRHFHQILTKVAEEFRHHEKKMKAATLPRDIAAIEKMIQTRYGHYEKDSDFVKARQRHADLHLKLKVLKQRLATWGVAVS